MMTFDLKSMCIEDCTSPFHRDRTLSVTWITVGSQSSRSVEFMMLSIARFNTSIPATHISDL